MVPEMAYICIIFTQNAARKHGISFGGGKNENFFFPQKELDPLFPFDGFLIGD